MLFLHVDVHSHAAMHSHHWVHDIILLVAHSHTALHSNVRYVILYSLLRSNNLTRVEASTVSAIRMVRKRIGVCRRVGI